MSISLTPGSSLDFLRPFTSVRERKLDIANPNCQPVAFKLKTNAGKRYVVCPNAGRIDPGGNVSVSIRLQPFETQPPLGVKCRDKFLVISAIVSPEDENQDDAGILELAGTVQGRLYREKLKVVFLPPVGDGSLAENSLAKGRQLQEEVARTFDAVELQLAGPGLEPAPSITLPVPVASGPSSTLPTSPLFPVPVLNPSPSSSEYCDSDGFVVVEHENQSGEDEWCSVSSGISSSSSSAVDLGTASANSGTGLATELANAKAEIQRLHGLLHVGGTQSSPTTT